MSDAEKVAEELGGKAEEIKYTIRWTIKLIPPGGIEPEFVTMEMEEDSYIAYQIIKRTKEMLLSDGYTEVQIVSKSRGYPAAKPPESKQPAAGGDAIPVGKYRLSKARKDWFKLELFGFFDDGGVHSYPDLTFHANTEGMWGMVGALLNGPTEGDLPMEGDVNWLASWEYGREMKNKPGERYQDLVKLTEAA